MSKIQKPPFMPKWWRKIPKVEREIIVLVTCLSLMVPIGLYIITGRDDDLSHIIGATLSAVGFTCGIVAMFVRAEDDDRIAKEKRLIRREEEKKELVEQIVKAIKENER
jgi:hypothetical protein